MTATEPGRRPSPDPTALQAAATAVEANPDVARFRFGASNRWLGGAHSRSLVHGFHGATQDLAHLQPWTVDADQPGVLAGADNGPSPLEYLLHAVAACLAATLATAAAEGGVELASVESRVEGDVDVRGQLGVDGGTRAGFEQVRVRLAVRGARPAELAEVVARARRRSPVLDVLANGVPVHVEVDLGPAPAG